MTKQCKEKWKTLWASSGTSWNKVPKNKVELGMGCGGRQENGMYPPKVRVILVPKSENPKNTYWGKYELTDSQIRKFRVRRQFK